MSYSYFSRFIGLGLFFRALSPSFATVSLSRFQDRRLFEGGVNVSKSLSSILSLGVQVAGGKWRESGRFLSGSVSGSLRIGERFVASLTSGGRLNPGNASAVFETMFTLNMDLGPGTWGSISSRRDSNGVTGAADLAHSVPAGSGFGYRLRGEFGQQRESRMASARAEYQGVYGRVAGEVDRRPETTSTLLEGSGSLVYVDGRVMLTRRVDQGFALVRVPGVAGVRVFRENHEMGRTDARGDFLLPNVLSYYANRVSISDLDLPLDHYVSAVEQVAAPTYRGAVVVRFDAKRLQGVRGKLAISSGVSELIPSFGEIKLHDSRGSESPIGKGGEFEFGDLAGGSYEAEISYDRGRCKFILEVPRETNGLADLGVVRCREN